MNTPDSFDFETMSFSCQQCGRHGPSAKEFTGSRVQEARRLAIDAGFETRGRPHPFEFLFLCPVCKTEWPTAKELFPK